MRKNSTPATVYLTNGFQLKGVIIAFDSYTVLMEVEGKQMLLFKHAISTIAPINVATVMDEA
jgi:host factor-I protein